MGFNVGKEVRSPIAAFTALALGARSCAAEGVTLSVCSSRMTVIPVFFVALIAILCDFAAAEVYTRPPSIDKQPGFEQLFRVSQGNENKPFDLDCEASGNPHPKFYWKKNDQPFDHTGEGDRITQEPMQGTLHFSKPESSDEGYYQCFAENNYGTAVSNSVFLRKSELNPFNDEKPEEVYVVLGDPLTLNCTRPSGYPEPVLIWVIMQNTQGLRSINNPRIVVDPNGSLHFSNVSLEDINVDGQYACSAPSFFKDEYKMGRKVILKLETNETKTSTEASRALVKKYVSPEKIGALRGQIVELYCIYGGTPNPRVSWTKDNSIIDENRVSFTNFNKTLRIKSVDFEDQGTYECIVDNGVQAPESNTMVVEVDSAPFWKIAPNNTNKDDGETVYFECLAGGKPEPKLAWFINGEPLEKSPLNERRKVEGNVLTIERLTKKDTAVYQCNATNSYGYAFKDFYINVLALPPSFYEKPNSMTKVHVNSTVKLKCRAFGAPKPKIVWLRNNEEVKDDRYHVSPEGDLRITNVSQSDEGKFICSATNKFGKIFANAEIEVEWYSAPPVVATDSNAVVATESTGHLAKADWLIGMLCVIALVIILAILVCIVKRNRGGKYHVHEKEAALGKDMDYGDEAPFDEYSKPMDPRKVGSKTSLTSSVKHADGNDADSMTDYGDDDSSKFGEDGSFIGEYGKKKNSPPQPPTFV